MNKQSLGMMITSLRKEKQMTQLELANLTGVTDKAVSKWERDICYPDVNSLPKLAEIFGISVDELMKCKIEAKSEKMNINAMVQMIFKAVSLAMGVGVAVLSIITEIDIRQAIFMLAIAVALLAITSLNKD